MLATQSQIFTMNTGRIYDREQVLEFAFVQNDESEFTYYVNDEARLMYFAITITLDDPESETEASLGRKILNSYDKQGYVGTSLELEIKGKEIFQALKAA